MISDEQRFVWDIESLQDVAKYPDTRNLIDSSVILRRLLTDSAGPLIHRIAKRVDMQPRFTVLLKSTKEDVERLISEMTPDIVAMQINPDPSVMHGASTQQVGLDALLAIPVAYFEGKLLTVKEMINYVANVGGGVHKGQPKKKDNAETIHRTANILAVNGNPYPVENLKGIVNITIAGLTPHYLRLRV